MLLAAYTPPAAGHADTAAAVAAAAMPQDGVFAVMTKLGRSAPRIFALRARDTLLTQLQQVARSKLAINVISRCPTSALPSNVAIHQLWSGNSCLGSTVILGLSAAAHSLHSRSCGTKEISSYRAHEHC